MKVAIEKEVTRMRAKNGVMIRMMMRREAAGNDLR